MANIYNLVSTERDIITQFASDFTTKQSEILADVANLQAQIDAAMQVENAETATLCQIQSQLDGLSLSNTLASLSAVDADLNAKFNAYTDLVKSNNSVATEIYNKLQTSAGIITNVQTTMNCLKNSVSSISATLSQYSGRSVNTSNSPVVIPPPSEEIPAPTTEVSAPIEETSVVSEEPTPTEETPAPAVVE